MVSGSPSLRARISTLSAISQYSQLIVIAYANVIHMPGERGSPPRGIHSERQPVKKTGNTAGELAHRLPAGNGGGAFFHIRGSAPWVLVKVFFRGLQSTSLAVESSKWK